MNLQQIFRRFPDQEACIEHLERIGFANEPFVRCAVWLENAPGSRIRTAWDAGIAIASSPVSTCYLERSSRKRKSYYRTGFLPLEELPMPRKVCPASSLPRPANESEIRLLYATQKPMKLIERIIKARSNKNDVVFDPFCGCTTTLEAALRLRGKLGPVEGKTYTI